MYTFLGGLDTVLLTGSLTWIFFPGSTVEEERPTSGFPGSATVEEESSSGFLGSAGCDEEQASRSLSYECELSITRVDAPGGMTLVSFFPTATIGLDTFFLCLVAKENIFGRFSLHKQC